MSRHDDLSARSPYESMWLVAMFDLPVGTPDDRRAYTQFRNRLIEAGFSMLQFSVYYRFCKSEHSAKQIMLEVKPAIPSYGQIRFLMVTEKQFAKMKTYIGKKPVEKEKLPEQLMFF